jgi:hypothetical protein
LTDSNEKSKTAGTTNGKGGGGGSNPGSDKFEDKSQPLPPVSPKTREGNDPSVAPDSAPPSLVLRKLEELLKDDKFTPDVEKKLGMSKEEAEQFVKKYEKREQPGPAGPGRTIDVKPEKEKVIDPNRKAPEFNPKGQRSERASRTGTLIPTDNISQLNEGGKSAPPPELRRSFEAYMKGVANSKGVAPPSSPPPAKR